MIGGVSEAARERTPLVLLHGVTMSGRVWRPVVPLLSDHHEVHTPTALGHRGGTSVTARPVTIEGLVDDLERRLDGLGLDRVHAAGNSLGGWMAIELARRGRAASVTALSPGGFFDTASRAVARRTLNRVSLMARLGRPLGALPHHVPLVRRLALADVSTRGHLVPTATAITSARDLAACEALADVLATEESVEPLEPLPCPVTIAWSEHDRVLPLDTCGSIARRRLPDARFVILPGLGHVPMLDDPAMVADVVLRTTGAARAT